MLAFHWITVQLEHCSGLGTILNLKQKKWRGNYNLQNEKKI